MPEQRSILVLQTLDAEAMLKLLLLLLQQP